jgi:hypothetical protein
LFLLILSPYATAPAHANPPGEIVLNSSTLQVVHNPTPDADVLNMSLNVTSAGEGGCDGGDDDFIATGFSVTILKGTCISQVGLAFSYTIPGYVVHHIGSATYGTYFAPKAPAGAVSSKIVALATPPNTCGTWQINFQATGQDLEYLDTNQAALLLNDSDDSGPFCFDVNAQIGNGILKPHQGAHRARH